MQLLHRQTASDEITVQAITFQEEIVTLIRALGLHRPDQTPCGQPVSVGEAQAILELSREPRISQNGLAAKLRLEKSTVSRLAGMLERRGWLERSRDRSDSRVLRLRLTASGARAARNLATSRAQKFSRVFDAVPPDQRDSILKSLSILSEVLIAKS
jgi:DNA-binding MarR family transcriptional regulator